MVSATIKCEEIYDSCVSSDGLVGNVLRGYNNIFQRDSCTDLFKKCKQMKQFS